MRKRILYISVITLFVVVAVLFAQYSPDNYREQGGARLVIGGDIDIISGGELNIEDGGDFYMEPTDTTPTAEEGWIYFDDSENALTYHNGSGWVTVSTASANNLLRRATVEVTADQMDNLAATQIDLVATPGASAMLEFVSAVLALDYGGTAYTETDDNLAIRFTDGSGVIVSDAIEATGFADATADTVLFVAPLADGTSSITAKTAAVNQALVLDNTGNGEWGNSGNSPVQVIIYYRIHTTAELGL